MLRCILLASGHVTLTVGFSRGSSSKQVLLTCRWLDLSGAVALNVNVDGKAGSDFQGYCLSPGFIYIT